MWKMEAHSEYVLTLANSIIGVSILAMPYCFKQCGILLAVLILMVSNLISRLSCHFLIKSAIIARRRTFEFLAYYIFGSLGKLAIEVGMIGFLFGTCVAYFVVMGDLGPEIISEISGQETTSAMRSTILLALAIFCVLPLGLLKNVDSLSVVSKATIGFYFGLVMKITIDALPHIFSGDWITKVEFWRPEGIIQCLPIFSMALSCQTQLFEIYQVVHNPSLEKMNHVIKNAINMCTMVYFLVGFFGYIAFANKNFTGNILLSFTPSLLTSIIKLGFIMSVAFSFPLVIFPCRVSVHSLIYRQGISIHEGINDYIPEGRFKVLTLIIVLISLIIGILIPNIEFVLGLVGSSIGIMVCVLFPVLCFIYISQKNTNERLLAKLILIVGLIIMTLGTYENLLNIEKIQSSPVITNLVTENRQLINILPADIVGSNKVLLENQILQNVEKQSSNLTRIDSVAKITDSPEIRHEPPQPVEPQDSQPDLGREEVMEKEANGNLNVNESKDKINYNAIRKDKISESENGRLENQKDKSENAVGHDDKINPIEHPDNDPNNLDKSKNDIVDIEAIKKDDKEILLQEDEVKDSHLEEHQILIDKLQKQNEVQEEIVKQQKKIIEVFEKQQERKVNDEKLKAEIKAVKEIESIALKAIEKISGDAKQNDQIVAELEKNVLQKVNAKEKAEEGNSHNNKSEENVEIKELKLMNNLLSAKIKENNITHKPINEIKEDKVYEEVSKNVNRDIKPLNAHIVPSIASSKIDNRTENNHNNTAPLFLNLGQVVNKTAFDPVKDGLPLPVVVSYLQQQNTNLNNSKGLSLDLSKALNNSTNIKNTEHLENKNAVSAEDVKVMRRDILAYAAFKRKR